MGGQAIDYGIPVVTNDRNLARVVGMLGGEVR